LNDSIVAYTYASHIYAGKPAEEATEHYVHGTVPTLSCYVHYRILSMPNNFCFSQSSGSKRILNIFTDPCPGFTNPDLTHLSAIVDEHNFEYTTLLIKSLKLNSTSDKKDAYVRLRIISLVSGTVPY
jgi:hypothetical protein